MDKEEITEEQQKQSFNYLKGIVYRGYYDGLREVEGDDEELNEVLNEQT